MYKLSEDENLSGQEKIRLLMEKLKKEKKQNNEDKVLSEVVNYLSNNPFLITPETVPVITDKFINELKILVSEYGLTRVTNLIRCNDLEFKYEYKCNCDCQKSELIPISRVNLCRLISGEALSIKRNLYIS